MQELDAKVAAAIGLKPHDFDYNPDPRDPPCWAYFDDHEAAVVRGKIWKRDGVNWNPFSPSTDLNAAFEAAEKVGLFRSHYRGNSRTINCDWFVTRMPSNDDGVFASAPTPAEAICLAILELKPTIRGVPIVWKPELDG